MTTFVPAALAVALAVAGCGGAQTTGTGEPLALPLTDLDGAPASLHEYRGEVVVLHLFTIGSMAAQMDVLQLNGVTKRAVVLGIALDPPDSLVLVRAWSNAAGADYDVLLGGASIAAGKSPLGTLTVPSTVVLDRKGRVAFRAGRQLRARELEEAVSRVRGDD